MKHIRRDMQEVLIFGLEYVEEELINSWKLVHFLLLSAIYLTVLIVENLSGIEPFQDCSTYPVLAVLDLVF